MAVGGVDAFVVLRLEVDGEVEELLFGELSGVALLLFVATVFVSFLCGKPLDLDSFAAGEKFHLFFEFIAE